MDTDSDWGSQQTVAFPTPSPLKGWSSVKKKGNAIDSPTNMISSDSDGDELPEIRIGLPNSSKRRRIESLSNQLPRSPLSKHTSNPNQRFTNTADTTEASSRSLRDINVATSANATTNVSSTLDISVISVSSVNSSERPSSSRRRTLHGTTTKTHKNFDPDSSIDSPKPLRERMKLTLEQECILISSSDDEPQSPNNKRSPNHVPSSFAYSSTLTSTHTTTNTSPFTYTTSSAFASSTTTPPSLDCDPPILLSESDDDLPTYALDLYTSPATTFENLRQHKAKTAAVSPISTAWKPTAPSRKRASDEVNNKTKTKEDKAQEKAKKAVEKAQEKLQKASERERIQREKKANTERDRAEKRAEKNKQKKRTTTERMATMIMRVTEDVNTLLQDCDEVFDLLCSSEITVTQFECEYDRTIQWQRKIPHTSFDRIGTFEVQDEKFAMVLMSATEFIALLCNRELMTHVVEVETRFPQDYQLTLVVEGLQTFFKSQKLNQNKAYRERILQASGQEVSSAKPRKRKAQDDGAMTQAMRDVKGLDVETAMVAIQCETSVMLRITESSKETAAMIHAYSRGVACLPDQQQFTGFGFSPHDRAPETVDKNGFKGLKRVWLRHLQQFNGLSEIKAQAIVDTYCSPRRLIAVFTKHGKHAIKDIKVRRGETNRNIGPKVSEVLYKFYTSLDPTALVE
eukprot:m.125818 g.125818  ORF g.125818 m.125818 type:complete len:686 (+) comp29156_c0_seq1:89-2146(+)